MNGTLKRILQTANISLNSSWENGEPPHYTLEPDQLQKLVELVVIECATIVDQIDSGRTDYFCRSDGTPIKTGDSLKRFFGG